MRNKKLFLFTLGMFFVIRNEAWANGSAENLTAIGQGISSPAATSSVNYTDGYTPENPNGVLYQNGGRLSLQYDQNNSGQSNNVGAELGYGSDKWGMALGYRKNNCSGCEGRVAANVALNIDDTGVGLRVQEDAYALGVLFGLTGSNRFGVVLGLDETGGTGNKISTYGLGYSYVAKSFTLTLDASRRNHQDTTQNSNITLVTPGISVRAEPVEISLNDRIVIDDNNKTTTHQAWFGLGVNQKSWHLVGYSDYVNDIALVLSFFF